MESVFLAFYQVIFVTVFLSRAFPSSLSSIFISPPSLTDAHPPLLPSLSELTLKRDDSAILLFYLECPHHLKLFFYVTPLW